MKLQELNWDPANPGMTISRDGVWSRKNADGTFDVWTLSDRRDGLDPAAAQAVVYEFLGDKA